MQLELYLPRYSDADVEIDEKKGIIRIKPVFTSPNALQSVLSMRVVGRQGRERRYVLSAAGKTGRLSASEIREVDTGFDKQAPSDASNEEGDDG